MVGDVVNVAARIEELNKKYGTKILISDKVYEKVENHVCVKTLSLAYLRGHKRPILVHALREFFESPEEKTLKRWLIFAKQRLSYIPDDIKLV